MRIEIKDLEGRDHFVVPTVMITEGVHHGSQGPVFYPIEELRQSVPFWNGKPVVVYHPSMYVSQWAGDPAIFNQQKVGTIFNTRLDGKRLKAEAWIDVERVKRVDQRVLDAIHNRQMMEVSTGLVFAGNDQHGVFNGKHYQTVAHNLKPDHLAILPDQLGACSIADGAGLVRNDAWEEVFIAPALVF